MNMNIEMERTVISARARLAVRHAFFGSILLNSKFEADETYDTYGATDGCNLIIYNPKLCKDLNISQFMFFLLHEVMHIAYMHIPREGTRDHKLWNIATDHVINLQVSDMGFERPDGILYDQKYKGLSAEEVYAKLLADRNEGKGGKDEDGGMDTHLPFPSAPDAKEKVKETLSKAYEAHKASISKPGSIPYGLELFIKGLLEPKVPWQRELHKYAGSILSRDEYSLSPPNRRHLADDIYLPGLRSESLGEVVINIDSSGSTGPYLTRFATEAKALFGQVEEVLIIVSDTMVQEVVKSRDIASYLKNLKIKGGGGTDHRPVFKYMEERKIRPELFIGLTDGASCYPVKSPAYPILWCLTKEHTVPPWGRTIVIND